jgi:hypothetical protein
VSLAPEEALACSSVVGPPYFPSRRRHAALLLEDVQWAVQSIRDRTCGFRGCAKWGRSKLIVVGQGRMGKTSTIKVMTGKKFDASELSTQGCKTDECTVERMNVQGGRLECSRSGCAQHSTLGSPTRRSRGLQPLLSSGSNRRQQSPRRRRYQQTSSQCQLRSYCCCPRSRSRRLFDLQHLFLQFYGHRQEG